MADNFLENKFDEYRQRKSAPTTRSGHSLDSLLKRNRSYRGYDRAYNVPETVLCKMVETTMWVPTGKNQQALRFKLVTGEEDVRTVTENVKLGALLPELHLPLPGTEPKAYIIICSTIPECKRLDIDLGIAAQSMLLKAVEMGYNGLIIAAFNARKITEAFALPYPPALILAVGKGAEKIELTEIPADGDHHYYRDENGTHYVPKVRWQDLII
mgnify:CR=1 FL=1